MKKELMTTLMLTLVVGACAKKKEGGGSSETKSESKQETATQITELTKSSQNKDAEITALLDKLMKENEELKSQQAESKALLEKIQKESQAYGANDICLAIRLNNLNSVAKILAAFREQHPDSKDDAYWQSMGGAVCGYPKVPMVVWAAQHGSLEALDLVDRYGGMSPSRYGFQENYRATVEAALDAQQLKVLEYLYKHNANTYPSHEKSFEAMVRNRLSDGNYGYKSREAFAFDDHQNLVKYLLSKVKVNCYSMGVALKGKAYANVTALLKAQRELLTCYSSEMGDIAEIGKAKPLSLLFYSSHKNSNGTENLSPSPELLRIYLESGLSTNTRAFEDRSVALDEYLSKLAPALVPMLKQYGSKVQ